MVLRPEATSPRTGGMRWSGPLLTLVMLFSLAGVGLQRPIAAAQSDAAQPAGQEVNVELMLDSSGSMAQEIQTGVTRIDAAKSVLTEVVTAVPEDRPNLNVGFRVFGHRGNNTPEGREESCQSSDLTIPIEGVNKEELQGQVDSYQPVGWTPIALSLQRAADDFEPFPADDARTNAVVLVTDGLETCSADTDDQAANNAAVCEAAQALSDSPGSPTVYVVGFGLTADELTVLQCIADNTGGQLLGANSAEELRTVLFTFLEELQVVASTGVFEVEAINGLFPSGSLTCGGGQATDSNPQGGDPVVFNITVESGPIVADVPVGICIFAFAYPGGGQVSLNVNIEADRTTRVRGSLLKFPQGAGEIYQVTDLGGLIVWQDQFEFGDYVWVLPGVYTMDLLELVGDPILFYAQVQCLPGTVTSLEVYTAP
ncbi:MAG: D-amino acid dehydrogenase large subunit [uncultured Thermomicrobiales bacterium]|uniref:D-amino acid dehydrogenase large subunit n=1 Tax=uncultured Thermomicrobiales bacterium TaxID=1645740 RepID=A0A6J4VGA8_9BACT|nr:MAG: D-amino acid dehydrogenase large subunit [uncultured Thermomicrobiales bacterium]